MKFLKNRSRGNKIFWVVILIVFFLMVFDVARGQYEVWKGQQAVEALRLELEKTEMEKQQRMAADTAGGSTPQETLQMFIDAVEAGDYELASSFVVEEKRIQQKNELIALESKNNLSWFLAVLNKADCDQGVDYCSRMKSNTDIGPYFVRFLRYPSGNWKIEKI